MIHVEQLQDEVGTIARELLWGSVGMPAFAQVQADIEEAEAAATCCPVALEINRFVGGLLHGRLNQVTPCFKTVFLRAPRVLLISYNIILMLVSIYLLIIITHLQYSVDD